MSVIFCKSAVRKPPKNVSISRIPSYRALVSPDSPFDLWEMYFNKCLVLVLKTVPRSIIHVILKNHVYLAMYLPISKETHIQNSNAPSYLTHKSKVKDMFMMD